MDYRYKRLVVLSLIGVSLVLALNYILRWNWFAQYGAEIAIGFFAVVYLVDHFVPVRPQDETISSSSAPSTTNRRLSLRARRVVTLLLLGACLAFLANWWLGWHWFGSNDRDVAIWSFFVLFLANQIIGLTPDEMSAYRASRRAGTGDRR
jgi:hypothetical protein